MLPKSILYTIKIRKQSFTDRCFQDKEIIKHYLFASPCLTFLCLLTSCAPNPNQAADFATDTAPWSYPCLCLCPTVSPNFLSPVLAACRVLNSDRSGILSPRYIYENKLGSFKVLSNALAHYQNSYLIRLLWGLKVLLLLCVS